MVSYVNRGSGTIDSTYLVALTVQKPEIRAGTTTDFEYRQLIMIDVFVISPHKSDQIFRRVSPPFAGAEFVIPVLAIFSFALHYSTNCIDWCFAGLVCQGRTDVESRHYASMAIDGDDLLVLSRSGDADAKNPHDGNLITLHRVRAFRELVY